MDLKRQETHREALKKTYENFEDPIDSTDALIALIAEERDGYEEKIEMMEAHYKELLKEYKNAAAMWEEQARSSLELLKMLQESFNKPQVNHIIEG